MFSALLFASDITASHAMEQLAQESGLVEVEKTLNSFPQNYELTVLLNTHDPDLAFIDLSDWDAGSAAAMMIHSLNPQLAIIGFGAGWADQMHAMCEQIGVSELLVSPVTVKQFQASVFRAIQKLRRGVQENLLAFLPAKAGSGCTTVGLNTAGCLTEALGQKVLIIEGDLHSGVLGILLNAKAPKSLVDALQHSSGLDYSLWSSCVTQRHGIDLLMSDRSRPFPSWGDYHHLLEYARSRYDTIVVDLPEVSNEATEEVLRRAKFVFLVCTPELPSLKLAQRRCAELEAKGVSTGRLGIIVNRWHDTDLTEEEIERTLKHGVAAIFPNDYPSVQEATRKSRLVDRGTALGKSFLSLAKILAGVQDPDSPPKSKLNFLKSLAAKKALLTRSH